MKNPNREKSSSSSTRDWSNLNEDLLAIIVRNLKLIEYIFAFRSVCVSWRSVSKNENFDRSPRLPWLLQSKGDKKLIYAFGNYDKPYETNSLLSQDIKSWHLGFKGWVLVHKEDGTIFLSHAFNKTRSIPLPSLLGGDTTHFYVSKAALSSNPLTNPSDFTLTMIYLVYTKANNFCKKLVFWRPGDESYGTIKVGDNVRIHDIIFHHGSLFAVTSFDVMVFDHVTEPNTTITYEIVVKKFNRLGSFRDNCSLVELGGDLMVLIHPYNIYKTRRFEVISVSKLGERKKIKDLGNRAIFAGANQSFSLDNVSEIPGYQANHIYFTVEADYYVNPDPKSSQSTLTYPSIVGAYNMADTYIVVKAEKNITPLIRFYGLTRLKFLARYSYLLLLILEFVFLVCIVLEV